VLQFRRTLGNALLVSSHRALTAFSDGCVRLLDAIGLKRRIRRLFRSLSSRSKAREAAEPGEDQASTPRFGT
jgi:hypothetical protein